MNAVELMASKGIKPSALRLQIHEYLDCHRTHPTVDEIYSELAKDYPTLSRTTVYNTVKVLEQSGIIKSIAIEGFRTRYDANSEFHGHFLCRECGLVYDMFNITCPESPDEGFEADATEVFYTGRCKCCLNKNK